MENENKFNQIALEFKETASHTAPTTFSEEIDGVNVGIRVKSLKQAAINEPSAPQKSEDVKQKSTRGRKSLKNVSADAALINVPPDEILFERQYYSIGEVAEMFHVNTSLIRFWENEFDILQPRKNRKGDRHFRPIDIKNLQLIYDLLRGRKLTIEGAKDFLKKNNSAREQYEMIDSLKKIKSFLLELRARL